MKRDISYFLKNTTKVGDCNIWNGCLNSDGYPRVNWNGSVNGKLHRVIWELENKESASGFVIRHSCDNPKCINPSHLIIGTPADNSRDRDVRGRSGSAKLNKDLVQSIRLMYAQGFSRTELAKIFSVHYNTISYVVSNKTWKFLLD